MRAPRRAGARALPFAFVLAGALAPAVGGAARPLEAATVTGLVRTALRPLRGVHVELPAAGAWARTDTTGRFVLRDVPAGVHRIELAAVGYLPMHGSVVVTAGHDSAGAVVDAGSFLFTPLRPDEAPLGGRAAADTTARARTPAAVRPAPAIAPPPATPSQRVAPPVGFFRTDEEKESWPAPAELRPASAGPQTTGASFADLLRRVAVADSITEATGGMGAPGFETWRQWGDRFQLFAADSARALEPRLAADSALVLRAVAYARARAALAAGRTTAGYRMAAEARLALARAGRAGNGAGAGFLRYLSGEVDRVFVPGSAPPQPPAPAKKRRASRRRR